jgi:hypothetical protein
MSGSKSIKSIGGTITIIGVVVLLIGFAMPATSTQTSETCINDPTGFGQNCVSSSVTLPNPLKGPVTGIGFFTLLGGISIILIGGREDQDQNTRRKSQSTVNGDFAEKLQEKQEKEDTSNNH